MTTESIDEEKKKLIIQRRKDGVNMRNISKELHVSFSTIGKVWRERQGQTETRPEKSITSRAFQLFEKKMTLVEVTIELDLNPKVAEEIHQGYLKLKGLDEIIRHFDKMKKYIPSFIDFVFICEENSPDYKYILDIFNLQKVIHSQLRFKWDLIRSCHDYERRIAKLKQEEESTKQRIENLKQEENNRSYGLYGNPNNYYTNQ